MATVINRHMILREMEWREQYATLNDLIRDLELGPDLAAKLCWALARSGEAWIDAVPYETLLVEAGSPDLAQGVHATKFGKPGDEVRAALSRMALSAEVLK